VVLGRDHEQLYVCVSDLQFGFRSNHSTDQCTMVYKETVAYYVNNGSPIFSVFWMLLNLVTKDFDRIDYCKLFSVLLKRKLPAVFIHPFFC